MIKIVSRLLNVNINDNKFLNRVKDYLVVGKQDRKIGIMSNGVLSIISALPSLVITSSTLNKGYLQVPIADNTFYIQFGKERVTANSITPETFPIAFPNKCLQIIGSQEQNDTITGLKIIATSTSAFSITIVGGTDTENISWIAIGY